MAAKRSSCDNLKVLAALFLVLMLWPTSWVWAGVVEFSGAFSYNRSNYGDQSYSWSRRITFGFGYYFWGESELEFEVQDILNRMAIPNVEDTSFEDQVYSINWIQGLAPSEFWIKPYLKLGVGQLNRTASGTYADGSSPPAIYDTITGVAGAGIKLRVYHALSIKIEGATYLIDGVLSTAKDNFSINSGLSIYF